MGLVKFFDIEQENKRRIDNVKNEVFENENNTFYEVVLTHDEIKKLLKGQFIAVQGSYKERLHAAELTDKPRRTIGSGGSIN